MLFPTFYLMALLMYATTKGWGGLWCKFGVITMGKTMASQRLTESNAW